MNKFSKILEGSKILAITDKNGREYRFVGDREREKVSAKMTYYLWLSRFFIVTSAASLLLFLAASLSLFNLAPQVTVEPFLIIDQSSSDEIVRYEPIAHDMASKKMMMETFVRQYVMYRNTIINDEREMMVRWYAGGILNYLSAPQVFDEFAKYREGIWKDITDNQTSQEVEGGFQYLRSFRPPPQYGNRRVVSPGSLLDRFGHFLFHSRTRLYGPSSA